MELTASHALQIAILAATAISGYAVVKSNLSRVMEDFEAFIKRYEKQRAEWDDKLDEAQSQRAVFASQVDVLKEINSVDALARRNREIATMQASIQTMQSQIDHLIAIHNGNHPAIKDG